MWHKKKWATITILAVTFVLLAGVIGGVAYAQTGNTQTGTDPGKTLLARVAKILGIEQKKVEDAFTQAQKQIRDEELASQLKSLVDQGKLTQQQADQYKNWWQSRPNLPTGLEFRGGKGFPGRPRGMPGPGMIPPRVPPTAIPQSS